VGNAAISKEGKQGNYPPVRRLSPAQVEEYKKRIYVSNVMSLTPLGISVKTNVSC